MNRFFFITSVLFLSVTSVVLFGGSSAYASSPYDNVFSVVDNVSINHLQGAGTSRDYSIDWSSEAVAAAQAKCDRIGGQSCQDVIDLNNLVGSTDQDDNDWAVFADPSHNFYTIVYTTTPNTGTTSWIQLNGDYYFEFGSTAPSSIRSINIYYWPEGYDHSENGSYAGISSASGISVNAGYPVFLSTFPMTYPEGAMRGILYQRRMTRPQSMILHPTFSLFLLSTDLLLFAIVVSIRLITSRFCVMTV